MLIYQDLDTIDASYENEVETEHLLKELKSDLESVNIKYPVHDVLAEFRQSGDMFLRDLA